MSQKVARSSVQTLTFVGDATALADAYFEWLNTHVPGVSVGRDSSQTTIRAGGVAVLVLDEIETARFAVIGGQLVDDPPGGVFEFRKESPTRAKISLSGFRTRMPLALYHATQYRVHEAVMAQFIDTVNQPSRRNSA
ncbi:MAG: hypothetical protein R3E66_05810 [bacterium]